MPETQVRVVGSGFTTFKYDGRVIAFLERIQDSGQGPVGAGPLGGGNPQGWEAIHPLTKPNGGPQRHPVEIATQRALAAGELILTIRELWNEPIWVQLDQRFRTARNVVNLWMILAERPEAVTCQSIISPPTGPPRGKNYHNCTIVRADDSEDVSIGAISVPKTIRVAYTHTSNLQSSLNDPRFR